MTTAEWVAKIFPEAHPTHRWAPDGDNDNIECAECCVRPYNHDAPMPCLNQRDDGYGKCPDGVCNGHGAHCVRKQH